MNSDATRHFHCGGAGGPIKAVGKCSSGGQGEMTLSKQNANISWWGVHLNIFGREIDWTTLFSRYLLEVTEKNEIQYLDEN